MCALIFGVLGSVATMLCGIPYMFDPKRLCGVLCTNGNARVFLLVLESSYV